MLRALIYCVFGVVITIQSWLPTILQSQGVPLSTAGYITSMTWMGGAVGTIMIPKISDVFGVRKPFILGFTPILGAVVYFAATASDAAVWVSAFLIGLTTTYLFPLTMATCFALPEIDESLRASAAATLMIFPSFGGLTLPLIGGYFRDVTGQFLPTVLLFVAIAEAGIIPALMVKETGWRSRVKVR